MKTKATSFVVALTLGVCACSVSVLSAENTDPRAKKAGAFYHQGTVAMKEGNYRLAETSFKEVLKIYPSHPQAKRQLLYLQSNRGKLAASKRKSELHRVVIPKVDIENSTVQESVEILAAHISQVSGQKVHPNFVVQDPRGGFEGKKVSLKLTRVPADTLLQYILDQSGGKARFDQHAIVISPRGK